MIPKSNHGHVQKLKNLKACTKVKKLKKKYFQNAQKNGFLFDVVFCLFFNIENDLVRDVSAIRFKAQCNASLFFFFLDNTCIGKMSLNIFYYKDLYHLYF